MCEGKAKGNSSDVKILLAEQQSTGEGKIGDIRIFDFDEEGRLKHPEKQRTILITVRIDSEQIDALRESIDELANLLERLNDERKLEVLTGKVEM